MKRKLVITGILLGAGSLLLMMGVVRAQSVRSGDNLQIGKDETIDSSLYLAGKNIDIAGTVNGDVFCAGMKVSISGKVNGDVLCAGQFVNITGSVDGSVRAVGQNVMLGAEVAQNASLAGQIVGVEKSTKVGGDLSAAGSTLRVDAQVGRDLGLAGELAIINGQIGRNVGGGVGSLSFGSGAIVNGSLDYMSEKDADLAKGATIKGGTFRRQPPKRENKQGVFLLRSFGAVYVLVSMMLVSLVLVILFPRLFVRTDKQVWDRLYLTAGIGALSLFAVPFLFIVLMFTIVGIPLGVLTMLAWFVLLALSGPVAAYSLGKLILIRTKYNNQVLTMFCGSAVLLTFYLLPFVSGFAVVSAAIIGCGALLGVVWNFPTKTDVKARVAAKNKR